MKQVLVIFQGEVFMQAALSCGKLFAYRRTPIYLNGHKTIETFEHEQGLCTKNDQKLILFQNKKTFYFTINYNKIKIA